jgi:hypothetical protein
VRSSISYVYTDRGLNFTSDPPGANVKIEIVVTSSEGRVVQTEPLNYVTPARSANDRFVRYATSGEVRLKFSYKITVSKEG